MKWWMKFPLPLRTVAPAIFALALLAACGSHARGDLGDGLYLRTLYAFGNLDISTIYLGPGNQIIMNPDGGIDPLDVSKFDPKTVGKYKLNGTKLNVQWGGGLPAQDLDVEIKDGNLSAYDGGLVVKAGAYEKNQTLEGTYGGSMAVGNVSAAREITFTKDGRFTMGTLGGVSTSVTGGTAQSTKTGTYTLSGNTLTLKFSDGTVTRHTVIPYSTATDAASAKLDDEKMIFEHMVLKREK